MEHTGFNTFDLVAAAFLLATGIHAFKRGFIKEVFMLGTWIGASMLAATYYPVLTPWVQSHDIKNKLAAEAIASILVFGIALLALIPTGNLLAGLIKGPTLTSIDKSLGFVFGLMKGLLILCLFFLVLSFVWPKKDEQPEWLAKARFQPLLADGADMIKSFVPEDELSKTEKRIQSERDSAQEAVDNAQRLEELSTPVPWVDKASEKVDKKSDEANEVLELNRP